MCHVPCVFYPLKLKMDKDGRKESEHKMPGAFFVGHVVFLALHSQQISWRNSLFVVLGPLELCRGAPQWRQERSSQLQRCHRSISFASRQRPWPRAMRGAALSQGRSSRCSARLRPNSTARRRRNGKSGGECAFRLK